MAETRMGIVTGLSHDAPGDTRIHLTEPMMR
jgi:hypothetical protein